MKAKDVYNLSRALTGLYPLKSNFNGQVVKFFDIQMISGSLDKSQLEKEPGKFEKYIFTDNFDPIF